MALPKSVPSALPREVSEGLMVAKLPYLVALLHGVPVAAQHFRAVESGLNFHKGRITNRTSAEAHGLRYVPPREALGLRRTTRRAKH